MNQIGYIAPLGRAWARAERMLFRPFRLEFWLVLGFAAFLADLTGSGGFRGGNSWGNKFPGGAAQSIHDFLHEPYVLLIVGTFAILGIVLAIVLTWVSARGKFIFLDDVLHERARIVDPWRRFARLGDSLFVFEMIVSLAIFFLMLILFARPGIEVVRSIWQNGSFPEIDLISIAIRTLIAASVLVPWFVFSVMTRHFVVIVMWKHDFGVLAAWARFWPVLADHPVAFFVYLLFLLVLAFALVVLVLGLGLLTCCIGLLLAALPYVGSVILLPVHVTWRLLGAEFLAQFGPEWDARPPVALLPTAPPPQPIAEPPPGEPGQVT